HGDMDNVLVFQPHIAGLDAPGKEVVRIYSLDDLVIADKLDITVGTFLRRPAGGIERIEHIDQRGEGISAGAGNVASKGNFDAADIAERNRRPRTAGAQLRVGRLHLLLDLARRIFDGKACYRHNADIIDIDGAFGRYGKLVAGFVIAG